MRKKFEENEVQKIIMNKIEITRKVRRITQLELSKFIGTSLANYTLCVRYGLNNIHILLKISEYFKISLAQFFSDKDFNEVYNSQDILKMESIIEEKNNYIKLLEEHITLLKIKQ